VHGDRGSVVIENDEFTFVHLTPAGTDPDEKLMGSSGKDLNEVDHYRTAGDQETTAGRDPGQLSDAHRYQYENFLAALRGEAEVRVGLTENRRSIGVIVGAYESARTGRPVQLT
jgi:UDP-N-acetyl-2-amino-2-deoxyglucuronate dehydrogenase